MPDLYDFIKYGKLTSLDEARKLLAQHGVGLDELRLPHLVAARKSTTESHGRGPHNRFEPAQVYSYFRGLKVEEAVDKVVVKGQYFQQDRAEHRSENDEWVPGPLKTAPVKTIVKKKSRK